MSWEVGTEHNNVKLKFVRFLATATVVNSRNHREYALVCVCVYLNGI